jgi:hypothetical protein
MPTSGVTFLQEVSDSIRKLARDEFQPEFYKVTDVQGPAPKTVHCSSLPYVVKSAW